MMVSSGINRSGSYSEKAPLMPDHALYQWVMRPVSGTELVFDITCTHGISCFALDV